MLFEQVQGQPISRRQRRQERERRRKRETQGDEYSRDPSDRYVAAIQARHIRSARHHEERNHLRIRISTRDVISRMDKVCQLVTLSKLQSPILSKAQHFWALRMVVLSDLDPITKRSARADRCERVCVPRDALSPRFARISPH